MSIETPNSIIHHIPRTAGMFVRALCKHNGITYKIISDSRVLNQDSIVKEITVRDSAENHHYVPELLPDFRTKRKLVLLRDPITWYWSMWGTRQYAQSAFVRWQPKLRPFDNCSSEDFNEFVKKVADQYPTGFLNKLFDYYVRQSDWICLYENLKQEVTNFLEKAEGKKVKWFDEIVNDECPEIQGRFDGTVNGESMAIIQEIEAEVYRRFYGGQK